MKCYLVVRGFGNNINTYLYFRVENCIAQNTEIDISVDRGKWLELKANQSRKERLNKEAGPCMLIFPVT
jgi:hypothetical protein